MKRIFCTLIMITITLILLPHALANLNDGLVAYWPFNGNANDESGNGNHGTVHGATITTDRFGNPDSAYSFDGVDDYIKASADNLPTAERTVSLWFFANIMSGGVPLGYGGGGGPPGTSWLMFSGTLKHQFFGMSSHWNSNAILYYWPQPPVGDWYHFVVATDENGTKIYINGEEKASNGNFVTNTIVLNTDLSIGVAVSPFGIAPYVDANVGYHDGMIDDVRIYNRALSEDEIGTLYNQHCEGDFEPDGDALTPIFKFPPFANPKYPTKISIPHFAKFNYPTC